MMALCTEAVLLFLYLKFEIVTKNLKERNYLTPAYCSHGGLSCVCVHGMCAAGAWVDLGMTYR